MNIVCIGGGTGLSSTVTAWMKLGIKPTAIVATTDNGGSSGALREAGSPIPWGDIRKVLISLADDSAFCSTLEHRYNDLGNLSGHCLGNLMLETLYQQTGNVLEAINVMAAYLGVSNQVIPMALEPVDLVAIDPSGQLVKGETNIDAMATMPSKIALDKHTQVPSAALQALKQADVICIGPGSLLTSIMPALLHPDIQQAIVDNQGLKLFIHNCAQEFGPAEQLSKQKVLSWLRQYTCTGLLNAELDNHSLLISGQRYPLASYACQQQASGITTHEAEHLSRALAITLCLADGQHLALEPGQDMTKLQSALLHGGNSQLLQ